jgi:hypothetical protein
MKALTIIDQFDHALGSYTVANEGFIDAVKSMFSGGGDRENLIEKIKSSRWPLGHKALTQHLERDLKVTYRNPRWVSQHLPASAQTIKVPALALANINGKAITNPLDILKAARQTVATFKAICQSEKPFIDLRKKLINQIHQEKGDRNALADLLWEENRDKLKETSAARWLKRNKKDFPALGHFNVKGNDEWPVRFRGEGVHGFETTHNQFKTDGEIQQPSQANAKDFADALAEIAELMYEVQMLTQDAYVEDWETIDIDYDKLKHADEVFRLLCASQSVEEVDALGYAVDHKLGAVACGLYIAMFDKQAIGKPATEGLFDRIKETFTGKSSAAARWDAAPKFDSRRALNTITAFAENPADFTLSGRNFKLADDICLKIDGKAPVTHYLATVLEKTMKEAFALQKKLDQDVAHHARICTPLIERFEKTMIDNMERDGTVEQAILDKAMEPIIAAVPKMRASYFYTFRDKDSAACSSWLGGNPFNYMKVTGRGEKEWSSTVQPVIIPAVTDMDSLAKFVQVFMKYTNEEGYAAWKDGMLEEPDDDNWINYHAERPIRHLFEYMNDVQFNAFYELYSHDENSLSQRWSLYSEMDKVYFSILRFLDGTLVKK